MALANVLCIQWDPPWNDGPRPTPVLTKRVKRQANKAARPKRKLATAPGRPSSGASAKR